MCSFSANLAYFVYKDDRLALERMSSIANVVYVALSSTFAHLAAVRLDTVPSTSISTDMGLELGEVNFHLLQC